MILVKKRENKLGLSLAKLSNLFFKFGVGLVFKLRGGVSMGRSVCRSVGWLVCLSVEKIKKAKFKLAVCGSYSSK